MEGNYVYSNTLSGGGATRRGRDCRYLRHGERQLLNGFPQSFFLYLHPGIGYFRHCDGTPKTERRDAALRDEGMRRGNGMETKKAIICVDDEAIIVLSLKQELQSRLGDEYVYECAMSADEALQIIDELHAEDVAVILVISDWLMPGIKGDEFLIRLKKAHPEIKSIMITGHADDAAVDRVLAEAGANAVLKKPWSTEELITEVSACLAGTANEHQG